MDFSISEEQQSIQELAKQILGDRCTDDYQNEFDRLPEDFDEALWKQLAEKDLLGTALPEEAGGMGMGIAELCGLLEEQGRVLAHVPLSSVLVQAALPIAEFGSDAQRKALLPGIITGSHWVTAALQETLGDPSAPATRASANGDGFTLDGRKIGVNVAEGAVRIVVSARHEDGSTGLFLVDPAGPGVNLDRVTSTTRRAAYQVSLDAAPAELLGGERAGEALDWTLLRARVALATVTLGVAEEALRRTADYVSNRKQFGKPIGTFQGVALRSADAYIDLECMRTTLWQAIDKLDRGQEAAKEVAVAKWWACRAGQRVVHTAQHLHGGIGVDVEYPIHRFFLWAKSLEIELGGASQHRRDLGHRLATESRSHDTA
jgi:alkylation response protein AidB-like acyl-CoA dehydrogenase